MPLRTPVALFVFNRPEPTRRVFEAVRQARPPKLLLVADGPRPQRAGEVELCRQTRQILERVDWDCEVLTNYAEANLGCRRRVASGLDWVFSSVEEAILLEDDCLPHASFFPFCEELLERYRDDDRIQMIRGTNVAPGKKVGSASYYFSHFYNIWGWASWARAWKGYDVNMARWPALREQGWLERYLPDPEMSEVVRYLFDETHAGRIDTWDFQWCLAGWLHGALAVVPQTNLVSNIGFGADATHEHNQQASVANLPVAALHFPMRHPRSVEVLKGTDRLEWEHVYSTAGRRAGVLQQLRGRLRKLLSPGLAERLRRPA